jgi:CheY-like chemotaxis protein/two-component sensor histidine kinase
MTAEADSENFNRSEIIEKSALRASDIARKLLAFTRNQDQHKTTVDLNNIIEESIDLLSNSLPEYVKIELDLDEHLLKVIADSTQIQQVIMNLVFNARDAMPGGGTITIKTMVHEIKQNFQQGTLKPGYYVKLLFQDDGSGIRLEVLPNIFDPFFTTKDIGKGTGLGLSMVYGIVKSHNGTINVKSDIGNGTRFEILLPADEKSLPERKEEEKSLGIPKGLEVLIVDDETYVRDILGDILKFLGCKVLKAENGEKAIEIYSQENSKIDYVIIDLRMPKMDGPAAIAALERINPNLKIITTSGFDERSTELEKRKNIIGFLPKPYSLKNVSEAFETFLSNGVEK